MRPVLCCGLTAAAILFTCYDCHAETIGDFYRSCTSDEPALVTSCRLYMEGFLTGLNFEKTRPHTICLPDDVSGNQIKRVFDRFMRGYPKLQNDPSINQEELAVVIAMALVRAFPCP